MEIKETATETSAQAIAPAGTETSVGTVDTNEDYAAKFSSLESEKAKIQRERDNYRAAYLKVKEKKDRGETVDDEERVRILVQEELANSQMADLLIKQEALNQKIVKENNELRLANMNKATQTAPAAIGSHSEVPKVKDTLVTPDQEAYFKAQGKSDAWIDQYKKNLNRRVG